MKPAVRRLGACFWELFTDQEDEFESVQEKIEEGDVTGHTGLVPRKDSSETATCSYQVSYSKGLRVQCCVQIDEELEMALKNISSLQLLSQRFRCFDHSFAPQQHILVAIWINVSRLKSTNHVAPFSDDPHLGGV